jgi:hypothetical protein
VVNYGRISGASLNGVVIEAGGSVTNGASASIMSGGNGIEIEGGLGTVVNDGSIAGTGTNGIGVLLSSGGSVTNAASASITGGLFGVDLSAGGSVTNAASGSITGYRGVLIGGSAGTVVNDGSIAGTGTSQSGVNLASGGSVTNAASGSITGGGNGVHILGNVGTVVNDGSIAGFLHGVVLDSGGSVVNDGSIAGTGTNGFGVYLTTGGSVTNAATASIMGGSHGVEVTGAAGTVVNAGVIINSGTTNNSAIDMHDGGYVSNAATGTISSAGGANAVHILGNVGTVVNDGSIADTGTAGSGVYLSSGGSVTNAATASIMGGSHGVEVTGAAGAVVNAGLISSGATHSAIALLDGGYVGNVGTIISGPTGVYVGSAAGTVVNGGLMNQVALLSGGAVTNQASGTIVGTLIGTNNYSGVYITGAAGTLANYGLITNTGGYGVDLQPGGTVINHGATASQAAGTIISGKGVLLLRGAGTVVNDGSIAATGTSGRGIYLKAGGSVTNAAAGSITGYHGVQIGGGAGTVVNEDSIAGTGTSGIGVQLVSGGSVTNAASASITGADAGVAIGLAGGAGTVVNDGSITSTGTSGPSGQGVKLRSGGSVTNGAAASITGGYRGINIYGGAGTVVNYGSIAGTGTSGIGVDLGVGGSVTNAASASLTGDTYGVDLSAGGTLTNAGSIIGGSGTAVSFGGTGSNLLVLDPSYGFSGLAVGGVSASNTLELASAASAGTITDLGAEFINFGSIVVDTGADWTVNGGGSDPSGNVTVENDATLFIVNAPTFDGGSVYMGSGSMVNVSGASSVTFDYTGTATLVLDNPATFTGTIGGLGFGDVIELAGQTITSGSITGTTLTLDLAGGGTQMLNVAPGESGENFKPTPSGGLAVSCFAADTRLLTLSGEVAVEALAPGDVVVTRSGRRRPVRWLGHRHVDCTRHPKPKEVWPVRVRTGAFAAGTPHRDLLVSPDHAVFIGNVLIPIRYLINGRTILQEQADEVTYYHVELSAHDVMLAECLPCESYLDTGNRGAFANGGDAGDGEGAAPTMLQPNFARKVWEAKACAELVLDGPKLAAAKSVVLAQAEALGHRVTSDPGLDVVVDGRTLPPKITGETWCVRLPPTARSLRLVSRTWVPSHTRANEADIRSLGVAVANVQLDGKAIRLDDPLLSSGWHAPESLWRWTDGDAGLALAGARELTFDVVMTGSYWEAPAEWEETRVS